MTNLHKSKNWKKHFERKSLKMGWSLFVQDDGTLCIQGIDDPVGVKEDFQLDFDIPTFKSEDDLMASVFKHASTGDIVALLGLYWHGQRKPS